MEDFSKYVAMRDHGVRAEEAFRQGVAQSGPPAVIASIRTS